MRIKYRYIGVENNRIIRAFFNFFIIVFMVAGSATVLSFLTWLIVGTTFLFVPFFGLLAVMALNIDLIIITAIMSFHQRIKNSRYAATFKKDFDLLRSLEITDPLIIYTFEISSTPKQSEVFSYVKFAKIEDRALYILAQP